MPVIPAKAGIQWKVVKYDLPGLIENLLKIHKIIWGKWAKFMDF
jgi:hypothetical protein